MASAVNERLRRAMHRSGHDVQSLAATAEASTKSVERWIAGATVPHPRARYRVAAAVHEDPSFLWPETVNGSSRPDAELITSYPRRNDVPRSLWTELLRNAERDVDILAFAGLFLVEDIPDWTPTLVSKAETGVRVRLLLGDPQGQHIALRDGEDRIGGAVAGRVAAVLTHYERFAAAAEIRLFDAPLYASIYRFDDDMLINTHVYGVLAAWTPTMHLRRVDGRYTQTYQESFERLWAAARPHEPRKEPR